MDKTNREKLEHQDLLEEAVVMSSTAVLSSAHGSLSLAESAASRASMASDTTDNVFELVIRHVTGQNVFWDGKFSLQSEVTYRSKSTSLPRSISSILGKFLPRDYFLVKGDDTNEDPVVLIDAHFKPIKLTDTFGSLFPPGATNGKSVIFLRPRDWYIVDPSKIVPLTPGKHLYDAGASSTSLPNVNSVQLTIEEVSGRKILWDMKKEVFVATLDMVFDRFDLPNLRVDGVLSSVLARHYLENNHGILEKHFWTDRIKVVGIKDTLDVLFMMASKSKLYLKYIQDAEEQQWQEIVDAINAFKQKIAKSDEQIRNYYSEHCVLEEMDELKGKIQGEQRNEQEIENLMRRMEPKLMRALEVLKAYEEPEPVELVREAKSMHRATSTSKVVTQPDKMHAQFYDWW